jgi:hypothetical protein
MRPSTIDIQISHDDSGEWLVWLETTAVGCFVNVSDALSFAALLECSPRARAEALTTR